MKFPIRSKEELGQPTWVALPGNPGIRFAVTQILQSELRAELAKATVLAFDDDNNVILADNKTVAKIQDDKILGETTVETLANHVVDWSGDAFVDSKGKPMKYTKENFKTFIDQHGNWVITGKDGKAILDEKGEEQRISSWLIGVCLDAKTFTEGDSKNSAGSSTD